MNEATRQRARAEDVAGMSMATLEASDTEPCYGLSQDCADLLNGFWVGALGWNPCGRCSAVDLRLQRCVALAMLMLRSWHVLYVVRSAWGMMRHVIAPVAGYSGISTARWFQTLPGDGCYANMSVV